MMDVYDARGKQVALFYDYVGRRHWLRLWRLEMALGNRMLAVYWGKRK